MDRQAISTNSVRRWPCFRVYVLSMFDGGFILWFMVDSDLFFYYTGANIPPTDFIVVHYTSVFHKKIATWGIVW